MKQLLGISLFVVFYHLILPVKSSAQSLIDSTIIIPQLLPSQDLFDTDIILNITLSGNIKELINDRKKIPDLHPLHLLYRQEDSTEISIPVEAKTRGHFRKLKENCAFPPLSISFKNSSVVGLSIFNEQHKLKLVTPCQDDEYVIREWLVYKLYNLITPKSFKTRLVRVQLIDTKNKKKSQPFYGILLEEEKQMAKRNGLVALNKKVQPDETATEAFLTMAVFEYLIGNTDWSIQYQQNIKLLAADSTAETTAVPYDFDHSGLVSAPYAQPAEALLMSSVRERRYRGYCITNMKKFDKVIALYNDLKKDIYATYTDCTLLSEKYKKATIKYLDEFYAIINNEDKIKKEFGYPCKKNGTGNVVIKGLDKD